MQLHAQRPSACSSLRAGAMRRAVAMRPRARTAIHAQPTAAAAATAVAPAPPKTGHHSVPPALLKEALSHFFQDPDSLVCSPTSGGVNNSVLYVDSPQGQRHVLRVYNNGNRSDKVRYEHEVLRQLGLQQDKLSFQVPKALPARDSGAPHVLLSSGAECCVFHVIPGGLARTTSPQEVGRATGQLSCALASVVMPEASPIAPYYDLFRAHHAVTRDKFFDQVENNPEFNVCREAIDYLAAQIQALEPRLLELEASGLPKQVIHGDLHFDNVMVEGDEVSGLLDFEFCAYDWRAMELAVALSKYVGEADPFGLCQGFVAGYAQHGQLSAQEISVIPDLINLRIFSNAVYFTGRALAKEDGLDALTSRANSYAKRVKWVNANRDAIVGAIQERMAALQAAS